MRAAKRSQGEHVFSLRFIPAQERAKIGVIPAEARKAEGRNPKSQAFWLWIPGSPLGYAARRPGMTVFVRTGARRESVARKSHQFFCTQNWYMLAKVYGFSASNALQHERSVSEISLGKRRRYASAICGKT